MSIGTSVGRRIGFAAGNEPPQRWSSLGVEFKFIQVGQRARCRTLNRIRLQSMLALDQPVSLAGMEAFGAKSPNVIVLGTHGRRGVGHSFMGSDAEQTAGLAPTRVLLARGGEAKQPGSTSISGIR